LLHEAGEKITVILKLLAHASPTVTQNVYLHWRESSVQGCRGRTNRQPVTQINVVLNFFEELKERVGN